MKEHGFILRAYGIYVDENDRLLVSDEYFNKKYFTKFPGGGMEYGEGAKDCVEREMMEELKIKFTVKEHFYTTDFFIESAFHPGSQVVSIYYLVTTNEKLPDEISEIKNLPGEKLKESFRFIPMRNLNPEDFTFPGDRHVARILSEWNRKFQH
jgi:8-oxo-dGTP diphosphatase